MMKKTGEQRERVVYVSRASIRLDAIIFPEILSISISMDYRLILLEIQWHVETRELDA